jgi:hypothetical protein
MDLETTRGYVRHRLQHAGGSGEEFTDGAVDRIYSQSGGVPRLVNKLADFAMVYAVTSDKTRRRRGGHRRGAGRRHLSGDARSDRGGCRMKHDIKFYWRQILRRLPLMMAIIILFTPWPGAGVRLPASTRPRRGFWWNRRRFPTTWWM